MGLRHSGMGSGEPFATQQKKGGGSAGVTQPSPWARRFEKPMRMHQDCYDNALRCQRCLPSPPRKPPKKEAERSKQLASITPRPCSAGALGPPRDTASMQCCSAQCQQHCIIHLLLPKSGPGSTDSLTGQTGVSRVSAGAHPNAGANPNAAANPNAHLGQHKQSSSLPGG